MAKIANSGVNLIKSEEKNIAAFRGLSGLLLKLPGFLHGLSAEFNIYLLHQCVVLIKIERTDLKKKKKVTRENAA